MSKGGMIKIVLSTGKVVFLRQLKVSDTETAAQQVSVRANGDANVLQILMQKALVQLLLVKIADNEQAEPRMLTGNEKEDIDNLFEIPEYTQVLKVIGKISGAEDAGKMPQIEILAGLA